MSRVGTPRAQCKAHCTLVFHQLYGVPELALASAHKAIELAEAHDLGIERPIALNRLVFVLNYQGRVPSTQVLDLIADAEAAAALAGDLLLRFHLRHNMGVWHMDSGNFDSAEVSFGEVREIIESADSEAASVLLDVNCGELNLWLGNNAKAFELFERVLGQAPASVPVKSRFVCKSGGSSSPSARLLGRPPVSGGVRGRGNAGRPRRVWS